MTAENKALWEEVFENLTEDISMYRWATESWYDLPDGYSQDELLWEILNERSRGDLGLSKAKNAPAEYKDNTQKLNHLWKIAENELNRIIQSDLETVDLIIKTDFSNHHAEIEKKLNMVIKFAQDGDLIDDPGWIEDDLREVGNDFLIDFQQMANFKEQLESDILHKVVDSRLFVKRFEDIEKLFKNSFGYFNPLSDTLESLRKREHGRQDWWLTQNPEWDDIQDVEAVEESLNDLIHSFRIQSEMDSINCQEAENAILYAFKELPEDQTGSFKDHLKSCSSCTQLVKDIRISDQQADQMSSQEIQIPILLQKAIKSHEPAILKKSILSEIFEKLSEFFTFPKMVSTIAMACLAIFIVHSNLFEVGKQDFGINLSVIGKIATTNVEMRGGESEYVQKILKPNSALKSGDFFQIKTQINKDAFYYIILWDSNQILSKLGDGKTTTEGTIIFPGNNQWYQLDSNKGVESIILIASEKAILDFDQKMKKINSIENNKLKEIFKDISIDIFQFKHE